jgi:translation initiation factor eIF-2B subunit delta
MLGAAGSAIVASVAKAQRVPVIVLCESYKFSEKVQLGSIVFNELGSTSEIASLEEAPPVPTTEDRKTGNNAPPPAPQFIYTPQLEPGYRGALESTHSHAAAPHAPYQILNPRYDCTPIGNISVVATETGLIPPTSIPVLIRELRTDVDEP